MTNDESNPLEEKSPVSDDKVKGKYFFGIRGRLTAILICLIVLSLTITSIYVTDINRQSIEDQIKTYKIALSRHVMELTENIVWGTCTELSTISLYFQDKELTVDETIRLAGYQLSSSRSLKNIVIYSGDGQFLDILSVGERPAEDFYPGHLDSSITEKTKEKDCLPSTVFFYRNRPYLPLIVPWKSGQVIEGYLWSAIDILTISQQLRNMMVEQFGWSPEDLKDSIAAFILDKQGRIIVSHKWEKEADENYAEPELQEEISRKGIFITSENVGFTLDLDQGGVPWLVSLNPLDLMDWVLVIKQKREHAYALIYQLRNQVIIFGLIFALIALITGFVIGGRLTRPIRVVADGARKLTRQEFSHRIKVTAKDEIGEMADTFNHMAESLEEYDARIKREVAIRTDLSRYLTAELVEAVINRKADLSLGGKRQDVTILYADVVNFTPLSESHEPEVVVGLLNELFTILTQIIFRHEGMVDKFIGDCVMALFGAPDPKEDSPERAVQTAIDMIRWLEVGNKKWKREYKVELKLAISIHCGEVIIGNVGSEKRMEYTAIGDAVNTAARMEKIAKTNQIVISEAIKKRLPARFSIQPLGSYELRGKQGGIELFEVGI